MHRIYSEALTYCRSRGLIEKLEKRLKIREHSKFNVQDVSSEGLHLLDAVHCVYDKKRTEFFLKEIGKQVSQNSSVLEAGLGTGILALFAATKAKHVTGLEINRSIFNLASDIRAHFVKMRMLRVAPTYYRTDATRVRLRKKVDVIINENIYTGMFFEKQVQIMNHLHRWLKPHGVVIPARMNLYMSLTETRYSHEPRHRELFVPLYERRIKSKSLSRFTLYRVLDFTRRVNPRIRSDMRFTITRSGEVNGILMYSEVCMPSGAIIRRNATTFLNNDIILALKPAIQVKKGDIIRMQLSYTCGSKPGSASVKASILK